MRRDSRTKPCVDKRTKEGKSGREIERILVRYIAREAYGALMRPMGRGLRALQGVGEGGQVGAPEGRGHAGPGLPRPRRGERADKRDGKGAPRGRAPFSKGTGAGLRACPPEKDGKAQNRA